MNEHTLGDHNQIKKENQHPKVETDRKQWSDPVLKRRETLPRVTNGYAGSFEP